MIFATCMTVLTFSNGTDAVVHTSPAPIAALTCTHNAIRRNNNDTTSLSIALR